ncbi:MAG: hypothetical protein D6766_05595 [Verrucomicrobia bacterium]|nr:MAG: hypothetical protein D6766_05595 [Verrucomicrobiota bacterium]
MKLSRRPSRTAPPRGRASFTILEVLIALTIFFIAIFAILNLVGQNLRIARSLSLGQPDLGTVAAELFMVAATNRDVRGGSLSGDFGELYPGAKWSADLQLWLTNSNSRALENGPGLYRAEVIVSWPRNDLIKERKTELLLYLP